MSDPTTIEQLADWCLEKLAWLEIKRKETRRTSPGAMVVQELQDHLSRLGLYRLARKCKPKDYKSALGGMEILQEIESDLRKLIRANAELQRGKPGREGPTRREIENMQAIERDWFAYTRHCERQGRRARQNDDFQNWRTKHGESNSSFSLEEAKDYRKRFKQHVRNHPEDRVSSGN